MANPLQRLLQGAGIPMPSPARSAIVQQLLSQAQRQPLESMSPVESLNIAAQPILAALLARRESRGQANQAKQQQQALAQALGIGNLGNANAQGIQGAGIAPQPGGVRAQGAGVPAGQGGGSPQQQQLAALVHGLDPQGTQGALQFLMQQQLTPPEPVEPPGQDQTNIRVRNGSGGFDIISANVNEDTGVAATSRGNFRPGDYQLVGLSVTGGEGEVFPTADERRTGYASRNLLNLEEAVQGSLANNPDFNPSSIPEARGNVPLIGNIIASEGFQQYRAGADEWTTNMVFLRSGATARKDEKDSAFNNLWYQPGDSQDTMTFKDRMRLEAMREAYTAGARDNRIGSEEADAVLADIDRRLSQIGGADPELMNLSVDELTERLNEATTVEQIDAIQNVLRTRLRSRQGQ